MIKNSIRQIFRTKVKTLLFLVLVALCALLLCIGCNLNYLCRENLKHFEEAFVTMGTVEQKPLSVTPQGMWDAELQDYRYYNAREYGEDVPLSVLDMENVDYISGPEKRPYYLAYLPEYKMWDDNGGISNSIVVIVSPVEDCIPDHPVEMEVIEVINGVYTYNTPNLYFCDHYNKNPEMMYADTNYIMSVYNSFPHNWDSENPFEKPFEWVPSGGPFSGQTYADGTPIENRLPEISVEAMDEEFYEKGHDKIWEAYGEELSMYFRSAPVTATDDLNLVMQFYNGSTYIEVGRAFEEADYEEGKQVCLLSYPFARRNNIKEGDTIRLGLRYANYASSASYSYGYMSLTAEGELFRPFYESDYTVVGIYASLPSVMEDWGYDLADNEIFIPKSSIKNSNENNIGGYGRPTPYNNAFRIKNGTIDEFMKEWEKQGIENLEITFYDKGYTRLEAGLKQMERMAFIMVGAGIIMAILVMVFFNHLMITRQKRRTAIERSLGASKGESARSIMSGILLIAALGCIAGSIAGWALTGRFADAMNEEHLFDTTFSAGMVYEDSEEEVETITEGNLTVTLFAGASLFIFAVVLSGISTIGNLKEEPLKLLSTRAEE